MMFSVLAALFAINAFSATMLCASNDYMHRNTSSNATSSTINDTLVAYFPKGSWQFNPAHNANREIIQHLQDSLVTSREYPNFYKKLTDILIEGGSSPEGSQKLNLTLSKSRGETVSRYIIANSTLTPHIITTSFTGRDWEGLLTMVEKDPNIPYRTQVLEILQQVANSDEANTAAVANSDATLKTLKQLAGGDPYRYIYKNIFPKLRATKVEFVYERLPKLGYMQSVDYTVEFPQPQILTTRRCPFVELTDTQYAFKQKVAAAQQSDKESQGRSVIMAVKSNLLYDAAITPNIGVEFPIGKDYSVQGNWMYAWWKSDPSAWYHRTYGGDISVRRWIGKKHHSRPLTGWHAGVYGQMLTYDFIWGKKGYLGDRWSWAAGVEGGYSKAIGRRLNLDFSLNFGYLTGIYQEYIPQDGCYVWQATKQRRWIGPTKAEISLVWLLGR